MSRDFPRGVPELGEYIVGQGGAYLHNIIRELGVTCRVCSLPVNGQQLCPQCRNHRAAGYPVADLVASTTYAAYGPGIWNTQAHNVVRGFKAERPGPGNVEMMENLLRLGLRGHGVCPRALLGAHSNAWAVVPSNRQGTKLVNVVRRLAATLQDEVVVTSRNDGAGRQFTPDRWSIPEWPAAAPDHVLVIDDSWASGAHAQSLAALLKQSGVEKVSIFTVARLLSPDWSESADFEKERLRGTTFDWARCPWTDDGDCP